MEGDEVRNWHIFVIIRITVLQAMLCDVLGSTNLLLSQHWRTSPRLLSIYRQPRARVPSTALIHVAYQSLKYCESRFIFWKLGGHVRTQLGIQNVLGALYASVIFLGMPLH